MKIRYSKKSLKFLAKQEKSTVNRIRTAIQKLADTPSECDIKEMQGTKKGKMRMRVGSFRIIYSYTEENGLEILFIDEIGNRGDIYK
ncbi:MAG: type II toxin-antitoxin system RelE/ParE family toxin [Ruminococcus sp.]|nr:type II toxin-antitoxin system RelE/ParE family toxin [Ruminococcus sp.]